MERIKLHDKVFKICISQDVIEESIRKVAVQLNRDYGSKEEIPVFVSVLNGSFMFTAELMKHIEFQCEVCFVKMASYCGTQSSGQIKQLIGLSQSIKGRSVIIVEDIVDTGNTVEELNDMLRKEGARDIRICTILLKPESYNKKLPVDYKAIEIPNDFIVGYGLDYNELGRQYKDIYVLDVEN